METKNVISRYEVITLLLLIVAFNSKAQQDGKIKGRIIDSVSSKPVEFAVISLVKQDDNKTVNGATTDEKGALELSGVPNGSYKLLVYFLGYKALSKSNIIIAKSNPTNLLGDMKLISTTAELKEVTVTTDKSLIENKVDRIVYNVEKDVTSQTGVATDILKKIPQVSVDLDGKVELQGNSNIRFLINGKPSSVFGSNLADVLQNIPANQIQSIEVITSPGAKYDSEGTGGIINIILKKSNAEGINGNISGSAGTRLENSSLNLNARKGKLGVNAFFGGSELLNSSIRTTMKRTAIDSETKQTTSLTQNGSGDFYRRGFQTGLGVDLDINEMSTISASLAYNNFGMGGNKTGQRQLITGDGNSTILSDVNNNLNSINTFKMKGIDASLDYKKIFKKENRELTISTNFTNGNLDSYFQQTQSQSTYNTPFNGSVGKNTGIDKNASISVDFTEPVSKSIVLETGVKTNMNLININSDIYLFDPQTADYNFNVAQSSAMKYNRNISACYISGTFKLKFIEVKAGCRYEYTDTDAHFAKTDDITIPSYANFAPSLMLATKLKDNQKIKLSFSHRVERPDGEDLNPFINSTDPKNLVTGNPFLKPEIANKVELGYSKFFEKGKNIYVSLFCRRSNFDMQPFTTYYPVYKVNDSAYSNVALTKTENIRSATNIGLNLSGSMPVTSKIELRSNISFYQRYINSGSLGSNDINSFNYRINFNATYKVSSTLTIEAFGNFNSPRLQITKC